MGYVLIVLLYHHVTFTTFTTERTCTNAERWIRAREPSAITVCIAND